MALLGLILPATLSGCSGAAPKGEVLARVDGKEITLRDVEAERRAAGAGLSSDAILHRLVDRTILANAARSRGLDQGLNIPVDMRRLRNDLLASEELAALGQPHLTPKEISTRLDEADRQLATRNFYIVRQLKVSPAELALTVGHASSPAAAEETLGNQALWLESFQALDGTSVPLQVRGKLDASLLTHTPILVREGGDGVVMWVESRYAAPLSSSARSQLARQIVGRTASGQAEADGVRQLQAAAKVTYQRQTEGAPRAHTGGAKGA